MSNARAVRAGFTVMEVIIAYSILALLLVLAFGAVHAASRPVTDATVRSHFMAQGSLLLARMSSELEGAHVVRVGAWNGATFVDDPTDDVPLTPVLDLTGRAVRFRVPNRVTPFLNGAVQLTNREVIWAFRPEESAQNGADDDNDGHVDEMQLIRVERDATTFAILGTEVLIMPDVINRSPGAPPDPPGRPRFRFSSPSTLHIEFTLGKQVDFDTRTLQRSFAENEFVQTVNVRNMNQ